MKPIVHGLERKYQDRIGFVYLDIDDSAADELKRQLGYRSMPQFFLVDGNGQILETWFGLVTAEQFEPAFQRALH